MTQVQVEVELEPTDLAQLEYLIGNGQFADVAHAIRCAVRTALHRWRYEEPEEPRVMAEPKTEAALASRKSSRKFYFVVGDEDERFQQLDGLGPEDFVAPANEWDEVYEAWLKQKEES